MVITLTDSLILVDNKWKVTTLVENPTWGGLYASSSALSNDEKKLFIGMRQYVGEFDFSTAKFRYLIPSDKYLNKLSPKVEQEIRQKYRE